MTSVRVIRSHSFGKIVNKRHFVHRFVSGILSEKQEVNHTFLLQFILSSSLLFPIGPFTAAPGGKSPVLLGLKHDCKMGTRKFSILLLVH